MKIERLHIHNYRCFKDYEIEFKKGVNVLIGKNGVGKTTLINSIKIALSFVFAKNTNVIREQSLATSAEGLAVESLSVMDAHYDESIHDYSYPISIKGLAHLKDESFPEWEIYKESAGGRIFSTKYKDAYIAFERANYLPIFSIYSDSYPHLTSSLSKYADQILSSGHTIPKNFGYYQWGAESACTEVWEQRYINLWQEIANKRIALLNYVEYNENQEKTNELLQSLDLIKDNNCKEQFIREYIKQAAESKLRWELINLEREQKIIADYLIKFSQPITPELGTNHYKIKGLEVTTRLQQSFLNVRFEDGESILFQNLPAGYKRLFSIVLDIAYRAYILQLRGDGILPDFLIKPEEVTGIVVIDEIDLHLHPSLEQEVVQRFQNTFPNIQFIMSTHSNLVIANLEENGGDNSIIKLGHSEKGYYCQQIPNIFGIGYEASLSDFMGTPPRNSEVKYLAEAYIRLEKRAEVEQAKKMKSELIKLVGEPNIESIIDSFR